MSTEPSTGRIVHYVSYGTPHGEYASQCRAAIITEVTGQVDQATQQVSDPDNSWIVGLAVLNPTGLFFDQYVTQSETDHKGGSWHWPERTDKEAPR